MIHEITEQYFIKIDDSIRSIVITKSSVNEDLICLTCDKNYITIGGERVIDYNIVDFKDIIINCASVLSHFNSFKNLNIKFLKWVKYENDNRKYLYFDDELILSTKYYIEDFYITVDDLE
jgi:hypothetical protein